MKRKTAIKRAKQVSKKYKYVAADAKCDQYYGDGDERYIYAYMDKPKYHKAEGEWYCDISSTSKCTFIGLYTGDKKPSESIWRVK